MNRSIRIITGLILVAILPVNSCKKDDPAPGPDIVYGTFTDPRDNQEYATIEIGTQTWFAENLNYHTDSGSWCYDDDTANAMIYGRLYTWDMAMNACPSGWHLPDNSEWGLLIYDYLGGFESAGGKLKETDTAHWMSPNLGATNLCGFTALPGGYCDQGYNFYNLGKTATFWSSRENDIISSHQYVLTYNSQSVITSYDYKWSGKSVRCVKDE